MQPIVAQLLEHERIVPEINSTSVPNATTLSPSELFSKVQDSMVQVTTCCSTSVVHVAALATSNNSFRSENNTDIIVTFHDGSAYSARIVGSDPFSDIAVLR